MADPSVTDWISAIATAVIGAVAVFITLWQWHRSAFSPKITSRIDAKRQAIELRIVNKSRASGIIDQISVQRPGHAAKNDDPFDIIIDDVRFEGFTDDTFRPFALPAMASARIIIQAPEDQTFAANVEVQVDVGKTKPVPTVPDEVAPGLGIFGLRSVLPPGTKP